MKLCNTGTFFLNFYFAKWSKFAEFFNKNYSYIYSRSESALQNSERCIDDEKSMLMDWDLCEMFFESND